MQSPVHHRVWRLTRSGLAGKRARRWLVVATGAVVMAAVACQPLPGNTVSRAPLVIAGGQATTQFAQQVAPREKPVEVRVVTTEWKFDFSSLQVPVGRPTTILLENRGQTVHDLAVPALKVHLVAQPGQTAQGTFTFDKPGTYDVECSLPGHKEAGMIGKLVVGDARAENPPAGAAKSAATGQSAPKPATAPAKASTRLPQPQVAPPVGKRAPTVVPVEIETKEVTAVLADGVSYTFWTFGGTVPGPMIRVRQGDTVELTLKNSASSKLVHSIDLHAVTGPGGGAKVTQVPPGGQATFKFKAMNPGVYVYHCATPMVAHHIANGMYGLIVVEPPEGLRPVDREFYVMQGDFYVAGGRGQPGHQEFSLDKMLDERPDYVLFNGGVGSIAKENAFKAKVGETVRIFFGDGGPNLTSSFHVIGEIFDRVYPEGAAEPLTNVQTTLVPTGGATIVEFKAEVPGTYIMVDHSLGRLEKGGAGYLEVEGAANPEIFQPIQPSTSNSDGH